MTDLIRQEVLHVPQLSAVDLGLFRVLGPGLGNLLFPISRALIGQKKYGGDFVYPTMRQLKIGTFVRREKDLRSYGNILRSRTHNDWKQWLASKTIPKVSELSFRPQESNIAITYKGLGRHFHDLNGESDLIATWLENNRRTEETLCAPFDIAVHVRLGDFVAGQANANTHNVRQEIEWYRGALDLARTLTSTPHVRIRLFTDGDPSKVAQDLNLTGHDIDNSKSALNAILNMAKASVIVTSRSSFSMWGVYLGNTCAIWDRRFNLERSFPLRDGLDLVH